MNYHEVGPRPDPGRDDRHRRVRRHRDGLGPCRSRSNNAVRGGEAILTFQVPEESDKGALTTYSASRCRNATPPRAARSVTWTAAPGAGIAPDQFALFRVAVTLPNTDAVTSPPRRPQRRHGVKWDQPPCPAVASPDPVPTLTLTAAPPRAPAPSPSVSASPTPAPAQASSRPAPDTTARWLAGAGLLVGALGVGLALDRRRRS